MRQILLEGQIQSRGRRRLEIRVSSNDVAAAVARGRRGDLLKAGTSDGGGNRCAGDQIRLDHIASLRGGEEVRVVALPQYRAHMLERHGGRVPEQRAARARGRTLRIIEAAVARLGLLNSETGSDAERTEPELVLPVRRIDIFLVVHVIECVGNRITQYVAGGERGGVSGAQR